MPCALLAHLFIFIAVVTAMISAGDNSWLEAVGRLDEAERDMTNLAMHSTATHPTATTFEKPCIYIYNKQTTHNHGS